MDSVRLLLRSFICLLVIKTCRILLIAHQNPSFIGAVLNLKPAAARVYLPPDANCFLSTMAHCLRAKNYVNLMVGSKAPTPVWLSPEEADQVRISSTPFTCLQGTKRSV